MSTTYTERTEEWELSVSELGAVLRWQGATFEVDPHDLERGGWYRKCAERHCDEGDCDPCERTHTEDLAADPNEALKRWHEERSGHTGAYRYCYEEPCRSVRDELEDFE